MVDLRRPRVPPGISRQVEIAFFVLEAAIGRQEIACIGQAVRADRPEIRAGASAHRNSRRHNRVPHRRATRPGSASREGSLRSPAVRSRARPVRWPLAGAPVAERSAARRRRRKKSGPASNDWQRTGECRSRTAPRRPPLPATVTRPSTKSVGASANRQRIPAQLVRRGRRFVEAIVEPGMSKRLERGMHGRRANAVQPAAAILDAAAR